MNTQDIGKFLRTHPFITAWLGLTACGLCIAVAGGATWLQLLAPPGGAGIAVLSCYTFYKMVDYTS